MRISSLILASLFSLASLLSQIIFYSTARHDLLVFFGFPTKIHIYYSMHDCIVFVMGLIIFAVYYKVLSTAEEKKLLWNDLFFGFSLKSWKKTRLKQISFMLDYLIVILTIVIGLFSKSYLGIVFVFESLIEVLFWHKLIPSVFNWTRRILFLSLIGYSVIFLISTFALSSLRPIIGNPDIPEILICLLTVRIFCVFENMLLRSILLKSSDISHISTFTVIPVSRTEALKVLLRIKSSLLFESILFNIDLIIGLCFGGWALLFPSMLSLPLFLWSSFSLIIGVKWDSKFHDFMEIYGAVLIIVEFVFYSFALPDYGSVGLASWGSPENVAIQIGFLILIKVIQFIYRLEAGDLDSRNSFRLTLSSYSSVDSQRFLKFKKFWGNLKQLISFVVRESRNFLLRHSSVLSLSGIFFCSLQSVNIFNAVYHIFFLVLLLSPSLGKKSWKILVAYTSAVISLQFIWTLSYFRDSIDNDNLAELIGLGFLKIYHAIIYILANLQLKAFDAASYYDLDTQVYSVYIEKVRRNMRIMYQTIFFIFFKCLTFILVVSLLIPLAISKQVTAPIVSLCILLLLILCSFSWRKNNISLGLYFIGICYCALVMVAAYLYQFEWFRLIVDPFLNPSQSEWGLRILSSSELFLHQVLITFIIIVLLLQIKKVRTLKDHYPTLPEEVMKVGSVGLKNFCNLIVDLLVIYLPKIAAFLMIITACSSFNAGNGILVCLSILTVLFNQQPFVLRFSSMIWLGCLIIFKLSFQLLSVQNLFKLNPRVLAICGFEEIPNLLPLSLVLLELIAVSVFAVAESAIHLKSCRPTATDSLEIDEMPMETIDAEKDLKTEFETSAYYYLRNIFLEFGTELLLGLNFIVMGMKLNIYGVVYALFLAYWLLPFRNWRKFWFVEALCIVAFIGAQYLIVFNQRFEFISILPNFPMIWRVFFGLKYLDDMNPYISADFLLLMILMREKYAFVERKLKPLRLGTLPFECNGSSLSSHLKFSTKMKLFLFSNFHWLLILLTFCIGIYKLNLIRGIFLALSLYFIYMGNKFLLHGKMMRLVVLASWICFLVVFVELLYQYAFMKMPLKTHFSIRRIVGLEVLTTEFGKRSGDDELKYYHVLGLSMFLLYVSFFLCLIQLKLNDTLFMKWVINVFKSDYRMAKQRAINYHEELAHEVAMYYKSNLANARSIQEKVLNFQKSCNIFIDDWVNLFGCNSKREPETSYSKKDSVNYEEQVKKQLAERDITEDDFISVSDDDNEYAEEKFRSMLDLEKPMKSKSWFKSTFDEFIKKIYNVSIVYRRLRFEETGDYAQALEENDSYWFRLKFLFISLWFLINAEVGILVNIFLLANFIHHSCLIAAIPIMAMLIIGVPQRPYISKLFWNFMIFYFMFGIIIQYFTHGLLKNSDSGAYVDMLLEIVGLLYGSRSMILGMFFKLSLLVCLMMKRSSLQTMGLWDYFDESKEAKLQRSSASIPGDSESSLESLIEFSKSDEISNPVPRIGIINDEGEEEIFKSQNNFVESESKFSKIFRQIHEKWKSFVDSSCLPGRDYYLAMFFFDAISFLLMVIFWGQFSGERGSNDIFLERVLKSNNVPPLFVVIAITNFIFIILDRIVYASKSIAGKIAIQVVSVLFFHAWLIFLVPYNNQEFMDNIFGMKVWYSVKCLYWLLSAYQIKYGFQMFRSALFLTKKPTLFNNYALVVVQAIPFLFEMRAIIDWSFSHSPLTLYQWLKFEDIFLNMFSIKCNRESDKSSSRKFGEAFSRFRKIMLCFLLLLLLGFLIWMPLIILSIPSSMIANPADKISISLRINQFEPFLEIFAYQNNTDIVRVTNPADIYGFVQEFKLNPDIELYQRIKLPENSRTVWTINPLDKVRLIDTLSNDPYSQLIIEYQVKRTQAQINPNVSGTQQISLDPILKAKLLSLFLDDSAEVAIDIPNFLPSVVISPGAGAVRYIPKPDSRDIKITKYSSTQGGFTTSWFRLSNTVYLYLYSEKITASFFSGFGIIGLYVTVVFTVGRFLRMVVSGLLFKIPFEDLPSVDFILELCEDLLLVREFNDYIMEETLYWQIITIFRKPDLLLEKTKFSP